MGVEVMDFSALPIIASRWLQYGECYFLSDNQVFVIDQLTHWVWALKAVTLPSSTEGMEYVGWLNG